MIAKIIQLTQGSPKWLEYRLKMRNASETAAVMGVSPWCTPYQLWLLKTGRAETKTNAAMTHGTTLEPAARAAYEAQTGHIMQPLVLQDGLYSASLDGMNLEGDLIVEIKCPYQGRESALWKAVFAGQVPEHYQLQVQHQLMVSGAQVAHLWVFDGTEGLLAHVERDFEVVKGIRNAWDDFQNFLDTDTPPPLTDRDTVVRQDSLWCSAAKVYSDAKQVSESADRALTQAREALVALTQHPREHGAGVSVTRFWKAGNVDYKKVSALDGLDLAQFRGKPREEVRVSTC